MNYNLVMMPVVQEKSQCKNNLGRGTLRTVNTFDAELLLANADVHCEKNHNVFNWLPSSG